VNAPQSAIGKACPGDLRYIESSAGPLALYAAGPLDAPPMLLIHSVNAAAAASEVLPLFEHFALTHRVYALDLPGYGLSARDARMYTPRMMTDAILATSEVIARDCGGAAPHALALSLACEFLARAACERPHAFRSLALVSPTAFGGRKLRTGPPGGNLGLPRLHRVLSSELLGDRLFNALTRPGVIRYFLQKTWGSKQISEPMWRYACASARMPGARHAPLCFLGGFLFSADAFSLYRSLTQPVWMSHGVRGDFTDYRHQDQFARKPNWRFTQYPTGALPYFEVPADFMRGYADFLRSAGD
jgi:pimeloyl-ACP methyl ester carboxylesterase